MKLGKRVQITIGVPDLEKSAEFFRNLEFQLIDQNTEPYPWAQFSDGQNLILLNQDGMVYRGLVYFNPEVDATVPLLEEKGLQFFWKQTKDDASLQAAMFIDPTGIDGPGGERNVGVNIVAQDPTDLHQPSGEPCSICGSFGEFAIPTEDYEATKAFWTKLGFKVTHEDSQPTPWGILMDGMVILGLHENDKMNFKLPSLTYFAIDTIHRIQKIKSFGYMPTFEHADEEGNIIHAGFETPDGTPLLVFRGDVSAEQQLG